MSDEEHCTDRVMVPVLPVLLTLWACGGSSGDPIIPGEPTVWTTISAGDLHTCGITERGDAYCWGAGRLGQLGDGSTENESAPVLVSGGHPFVSVSAGGAHTCGVTEAGVAYCWGYGDSGQLGNGSTEVRLEPVIVAAARAFVSLSAGGGAFFVGGHTCGVTKAGVTYCWGDGALGQLGNGSTEDRLVPAMVSGGHKFVSVAAGRVHTCGVTEAGVTYCWGHGALGRLGNGSTEDALAPVVVSGGKRFASVSAGLSHTCGVAEAEITYCWGHGAFGRLGNGSTEDRLEPVMVAQIGARLGLPGWFSGGHAFASVSAAVYHSCGVTEAGVAYCWGHSNSRLAPVMVSGGYTFASVSAGGRHTCGVTEAGVTYCWGFLESPVMVPTPLGS